MPLSSTGETQVSPIKCLFWYQNKLKLKKTNIRKMKNVTCQEYVVIN